MCSVGDNVEDEKKFMQKKITLNLMDTLCIKCRTTKPKIVLHSQYPYCKDCFISGTLHKFKAVLGKNRVVHPNENVLIQHKVGHASTAILHFLRTGLDLKTPKKIRFKPVVLYIENNYNFDANERIRILHEINEEANKFNFPIFIVNLPQYLLDENFKTIKLLGDDFIKISSIMHKKPNLTTQAEVLKMLEYKLLIKMAKQLNCKSVFIPDIGIDIASQLLTNISLGRGENIAYDTGTIDSRDDEVIIMRPLRNFTLKELAFYNYFNNLESVSFIPKLQNPYSCIQNLMEKFVSDLQTNYPATISTIVRTGDKLGINKDVSSKKCSLCHVPLGHEKESLGSAEATNFSHWVSTQTPNCSMSLMDRSQHILDTFNNSNYTSYCYSCNQIAPYLCK